MRGRKTGTKTGDMLGDGAVMISLRVGECYLWLRDSGKRYSNYDDMALDFGVNGTRSFFPLTLLAKELRRDGRFENFLEEWKPTDF